MSEEKNIQTIDAPKEQSPAAKSHMDGPLLDRRFIVYDKVKLSLRTMDIIISVCTLMLLVVFFMGVYKR